MIFAILGNRATLMRRPTQARRHLPLLLTQQQASSHATKLKCLPQRRDVMARYLFHPSFLSPVPYIFVGHLVVVMAIS